MTWPLQNRTLLSLLIGIGLVLVGLLSGILLMLVVNDGTGQPGPGQPTMRPVELGRRLPAASAAPESLAAVVPADIQALNRLFQDVAGRVTPTVVFIEVEMAPGERDDWFHNFNFRDRVPRQSVGSGVIISDQGHIVTNHHVVQDATRIVVTLSDKRQFEAAVVGEDPSTDLAVIQITEEVPDLPVIALGNSDLVRVGEWVVAVGNPFRLTSTVTTGIVSALGRQVNIIEDTFGIEDFIQTDAAINPGNSGGALVNLRGELIGINTAIATESGANEGYGFAVPVNLVERVAADLIAYGEVQRGFLGVQIQPVDAPLARQLGLERVRGVYVFSVRSGGAADRGGLRDGDVVLSIDGLPVNEPNELQSIVARRRPGDWLSLEVWRRGTRRMFDVQLLGRDDPAYEGWIAETTPEPEVIPEPEEPAVPERQILELDRWGIGLRDLNRRDRDAFELEEGAYVAYIENAAPAFQAGLPRDVVLMEVAGEPVRSATTAVALLEKIRAEGQESVLLRVKRRDGLTAFYELDVPVE